MPSGFIDRYKGKGYQPSGWLQQIGAGGAVSPGGGQINSTSAASTSGGFTGATAANTVSTFGLNYVVPGKTLERFGRNLLINAWGTFSTANAGLKSASVLFGTVTGFSVFNSTTITTLQGWFASVSVTQTSTSGLAAQQTIFGQGAGSTHSGCTVSTGTENLLLASTIKVTAVSSAGSAGGDVTLLGLQVEGLN